MNDIVRVRGVGRVVDEPKALLVFLDGQPTDDHIRSLHEFLRDWNSTLSYAQAPDRPYRPEDDVDFGSQRWRYKP